MNRALVEAFLAGHFFPATRAELEGSARESRRAGVAAALARLPEGEYRSANDVGEALDPVQPRPSLERRPCPRVESGDVPGGARYTEGA